MPKYYISSGDFKKVIDRDTHKEAAIDAFKELIDNPVDLGFVTIISEKGFDNLYPEDVAYPTKVILELSNQISNYKMDEYE